MEPSGTLTPLPLEPDGDAQYRRDTEPRQEVGRGELR
jgi:hypothetical protein